MGNFEPEKKLIVETAQKLVAKGYLMATGGNLSVRIPGREAFAITPSNYDYMKMRAEDVCILGLDLERSIQVEPHGQLTHGTGTNQRVAAAFGEHLDVGNGSLIDLERDFNRIAALPDREPFAAWVFKKTYVLGLSCQEEELLPHLAG